MADIELPALTGSEKHVAWATKVRAEMIHLLLSDPREPETECVEMARRITDASWWIDERDVLRRGVYAKKNIKMLIRAKVRSEDA